MKEVSHLCSLKQCYFDLDASSCLSTVKSFSGTRNLPLSLCRPGVLNRANLGGCSSSLGHQSSVATWEMPIGSVCGFLGGSVTLCLLSVPVSATPGTRGLPCWHLRGALPPHRNNLALLSVSVILWLHRGALCLPPIPRTPHLSKP